MKEFFKDLFLDLYDNFSEVFLNVIVMAIVMILGVVISWFIKKLLARLLILFRFDKWASEVGIINFLEKGGVKTLPSIILSKIIYWIFIVAFFSFGLNFIGISQFTEYAARISGYLPHIVVSIVIVIIGIIFSNFISRVIYMTCENANLKYGDLIAKGVRIFLVVITFGIVFEYIGIGNTIVTISFLVVFGGIILALSLALGIGMSSVLGDLIREWVRARSEKKK
jgi:hypothetical protein